MTLNKTSGTILHVNSSGRQTDSVSRQLTAEIVEGLRGNSNRVDVISRDLNHGVEFVDEEWIAANFTPREERTAAQRLRLKGSDKLVEELEAADTIVIGVPIYNFGIPAALKAWLDQIARAKRTFEYTPEGPRGLLSDKRAYVVITSGGVPVDSPLDFATGYIRQVLGFLGITDVTIIPADQLTHGADEKLAAARDFIASEIPHREAA